MQPKLAKLHFRFQEFVNCAIILAIFVPCALVFSQFVWGGVAQVVLIAILGFVFFAILPYWPNRITCPQCLKHIATNTPWVCGFCKQENRNPQEFPFLRHCEHCRAEPKAYRCHHTGCGKVFFLGADEQEANHAYCVNSEVHAPTPVNERGARAEAKEKVVHDIEMAELSAKLESISQRAKLNVKKSPREILKEDFQKDFDTWLGADDEAQEQRKLAREKYADNPVRLGKALDLIDAWAKRHTPS